MMELLAGVDEVGRGPLAGPVIAAAVILHPQRPIAGLADSKTLGPARRVALAAQIHARAFAVGIGRAEVEEIDDLNILHASLLAMQRAVAALGCMPGSHSGGRQPPPARPAAGRSHRRRRRADTGHQRRVHRRQGGARRRRW